MKKGIFLTKALNYLWFFWQALYGCTEVKLQYKPTLLCTIRQCKLPGPYCTMKALYHVGPDARGFALYWGCTIGYPDPFYHTFCFWRDVASMSREREVWVDSCDRRSKSKFPETDSKLRMPNLGGEIKRVWKTIMAAFLRSPGKKAVNNGVETILINHYISKAIEIWSQLFPHESSFYHRNGLFRANSQPKGF
jgi:hypothetical protein